MPHTNPAQVLEAYAAVATLGQHMPHVSLLDPTSTPTSSRTRRRKATARRPAPGPPTTARRTRNRDLTGTSARHVTWARSYIHLLDVGYRPDVTARAAGTVTGAVFDDTATDPAGPLAAAVTDAAGDPDPAACVRRWADTAEVDLRARHAVATLAVTRSAAHLAAATGAGYVATVAAAALR